MWLLKAEPLLILFLPTLKRLTALFTLFIFGITFPYKFVLRKKANFTKLILFLLLNAFLKLAHLLLNFV
ncbi:hypothetical protein FMM58_07770 [Campylobacter sp. LR291e]|nr:hypothetical protein FMM57_04945 [Campylobacter sp. LR286c]KAA6227967.1 hypothetical protein FMM54_01535 [Campylobacter sp. LR185c]KAA6228377.1 hypothetical protein FMM55_01340 [Campylobacter sp. LR196d]KAA6229378.1 hypothetical protein FMM58_07770 [Campylobacter sp. LR291e]KAA8604472.1 hypothetical protein CGP82_02820 [Campylobacter sp. LR185c]